MSVHELFTDRVFSAGTSYAGKKYAAGRVTELLTEDPKRTAQQLVDLLREEADAAEVEFERVRGHEWS